MTFAERCDLVRLRAHRDAVTREVDGLIAEFEGMPHPRDGSPLRALVLEDSDWSDETLDHVAQRECNLRNADAYALARLLLAMPYRKRMLLAAVCDCGCTPERGRG